MNVVPDTSAVVDGRVTERLDAGEYPDARILVPEAVVGELESQANEGRDSGWDGLAELRRLADRDENGLAVEYIGRRTTGDERSAAHEGDIDALIRDLAEERDATLLTSDGVQAEVGRAKGLTVDYIEPRGRDTESLRIENLFDETTMSLHLRTGTPPKAKRGAIGDMHYETIREETTTDDEMRDFAHDVTESARSSPEGFIELEEPGMTIVQFRQYRIAVARPPFADAFEITAVRPIVKTDLDDYEFGDELRERLAGRQRGVLISGAPGAGKSTFAQAVAEYLSDADYAVKTMEKPRDLQVGPDVTQYTELGGSMAKTADSLLMVRPDYTIYDEVRKTSDFEVFSDMRLAGVGMVGVVHATRAIDALQRLVGRVELGMIPQVVDTVVYIEAGEVHTVYDVTTDVKVPEGLTAEDLARPVIRVRDFETGRPAYEIYTFNRQVVTVPVGDDEGNTESGVDRIAKSEIEREVRSVARGDVTVDLEGRDRAVVYVDDDDISYVIGKGGSQVQELERTLGIDIDVRTHDERPSTGGNNGGSAANASGPIDGAHGDPVRPEVTDRHVTLPVDGHVGETVEVRADGDYLFTATVGRGGEIQVSRGSAIADELEAALDHTAQVTVFPA
jgi:ATPase